MESQIFGWANLAMDTVEVAAVVAVFLLLLRVHRNIAALLRVMRRMDRKTADTTASAFRAERSATAADSRSPAGAQPPGW